MLTNDQNNSFSQSTFPTLISGLPHHPLPFKFKSHSLPSFLNSLSLSLSLSLTHTHTHLIIFLKTIFISLSLSLSLSLSHKHTVTPICFLVSQLNTLVQDSSIFPSILLLGANSGTTKVKFFKLVNPAVKVVQTVMENANNVWEEKTLINELIQGMELTKQLRVHLNAKSSTETRELLLQRILSSYDKALLILKWSESIGQPQPPAAPFTSQPQSPISGDVSPQSGDYGVFKGQADRKVLSKKRKTLPTRTEQVRICSENGLEGNNDDGYSWRKYGQKDILGAKFPRSYYRCTYRNVQNCWATKQVQRTDEDPTVFEVTYKGQHTCNQVNHSVPPPPSPEKHETNHHHHHISHHHQNSGDILTTLRANLRVNTENLNNDKTAPFSFASSSLGFLTSESQHFPMVVNDDILGDYSPSFISPATSGSSYFTEPSSLMNGYRWVQDFQHSESSVTEMLSATTSTTNSPIGNLAFTTDFLDFEPSFPFNNPGFFN